MEKTALLIDGDIIAYRAAAVIEKKTILVTDLETKEEKEYGTRTEFKDLLKKEGIEFDKERFLIKDIQTPQPKQNAFSIIKGQIQKMESDLWSDETKVFISGKDNFRDYLELPDRYKGQRTDMLRPVHLRDCKKYLWKNTDCTVSDNAEADDYLIFRGYEYLNKGYNVIVATNDKDALAYTGLQIYDFTQQSPELKLIPDFGSIWERPSDKEIKGEGFLWFCFQWLHGDPVDNYKPSQLSGVRFGKKSAYNALVNTTTKQEAIQVVIDHYKEWYPKEFEYTAWDGRVIKSDYKHMLELYLKCAKMKTSRNDSISLTKFLKKQGVKL